MRPRYYMLMLSNFPRSNHQLQFSLFYATTEFVIKRNIPDKETFLEVGIVAFVLSVTEC